MAYKNGTSERRSTQESADCAYLLNMLPLVDVSDIAEIISPKKGLISGFGRPAFDRQSILKAIIAGRIKGYETMSALIKKLDENPALREVCNLKGKLPSRRTFMRVYKELQKPEIEAMLEGKFARIIDILKVIRPDLGVDVSVDATTVQSYTRRKPVRFGHTPGQCPSAGKYVGCSHPDTCQVFSDKEASLGFKYCSKSPDGRRLVQGYKVITLSCARYSVALATIVTTGRAPETRVLKDLFYKAKNTFSWFAPETLIADTAYDAGYNYEFLWREGVEPVINISCTPGGELRDGIYTKEGIPTCMGLVPMEYAHTDKDTGFHLYRCQQGGCDRLGKVKGFSTCRDTVWEDPAKNPRLFGRKIRRGSPEWRAKYRLRYSIERLFAWWKDSCNLEHHRFRGLANVRLHVLLTSIAYETKRLSIKMYGKIRNPAA